MKPNFVGTSASVRVAAVIATAVALLGAVTVAETTAKPQHVSIARAEGRLSDNSTNPWS
ncbi:hypothetical protein [Streptomyces sp. NPDC006552]|uniref:hypothetical protein n=1 Tax=Streptomyces sp. NPDC006552 TaxID=3157179 RepID=UPI0033B26779